MIKHRKFRGESLNVFNEVTWKRFKKTFFFTVNTHTISDQIQFKGRRNRNKTGVFREAIKFWRIQTICFSSSQSFLISFNWLAFKEFYNRKTEVQYFHSFFVSYWVFFNLGTIQIQPSKVFLIPSSMHPKENKHFPYKALSILQRDVSYKTHLNTFQIICT